MEVPIVLFNLDRSKATTSSIGVWLSSTLKSWHSRTKLMWLKMNGSPFRKPFFHVRCRSSEWLRTGSAGLWRRCSFRYFRWTLWTCCPCWPLRSDCNHDVHLLVDALSFSFLFFGTLDSLVHTACTNSWASNHVKKDWSCFGICRSPVHS